MATVYYKIQKYCKKLCCTPSQFNNTWDKKCHSVRVYDKEQAFSTFDDYHALC